MFSDFRLDPVTGDFGAEMRLAYWFDGERRRPVTGGSISGSVTELRSTMKRSFERRSRHPLALPQSGCSAARRLDNGYRGIRRHLPDSAAARYAAVTSAHGL